MQDGAALVTMMLLGAVTVAVLWCMGCFRRNVFDDAPPRIHGMIPEDLLVGIAILALSQLLALGVLYGLGFSPLHPVDSTYKGPIADATKMMIVQIVGVTPVVLFTLFESRRRTGDGFRAIGLTRFNPKRDIFVGLAGFMAAIWVCFALSALMTVIVKLFQQEVPDIGHSALKAMFDSQSIPAVAITAFTAILIAPVLEEVVFRGLVQSGLMAMAGPTRRWTIVLIGAAIFALMHAAVANPLTLPTLFVLGVFLGWMYERTGSLWPGIFVHAAFNLVNIGVVVLRMREAMVAN